MTMAYYPKPDDGKNAAQRYKEKCDAITIRPRLEDGEFIRSAAEYHGLSVTKYILTACKAYDENNTALRFYMERHEKERTERKQ